LIETAKNTDGTDASHRDQRGGSNMHAALPKSTNNVMEKMKFDFSDQKIILLPEMNQNNDLPKDKMDEFETFTVRPVP